MGAKTVSRLASPGGAAPDPVVERWLVTELPPLILEKRGDQPTELESGISGPSFDAEIPAPKWYFRLGSLGRWEEAMAPNALDPCAAPPSTPPRAAPPRGRS